MILVGTHITWFLCGPTYSWIDPKGVQWYDKGAADRKEGAYALQHTPIGTEGFAIPGHGTLGGYFRLTIPEFKIDTTVRHIDIGPGNVIDLSAPLAYKLFQSKGKMPDHSNWRLEFIGRDLPT